MAVVIKTTKHGSLSFICTIEYEDKQLYLYEDSNKRGVLFNGYEYYHIRWLIPLEAGRLMGIKDEDVYKIMEVNNEKEWYKQFGNSIVVNVLMAIFKQML